MIEVSIEYEADLEIDECIDKNNEIHIIDKSYQAKEPQEEVKINWSPLRLPVKGSERHEELSKEKKIDIYVLPKGNFSSQDIALAKRILVIGETGSGKTTLINALANFYMGVKMNDPFRYMLIVEEGMKE
jgi:polynucleotide 5'-kinase involved in rRNA processing